MPKDPPTINGEHHTNGEKSHFTGENDFAYQPLDVKKGGNSSNGLKGHRESYSNSRSGTRTGTMSNSSKTYAPFSNHQQVAVLQETVNYTRGKLVAEFGLIDEHYIHDMTIDGFLEYIERQRLTYMPHRGSRWDKVLKWAEFFGLQVWRYSKVAKLFVLESELATQLIWAASHALLELGPDNAKALEQTFGVFYQLGISLSLLSGHNKLLSVAPHIRTEVGQAFNGMLKLVRDVSIYYHAAVYGMLSGEISLDFMSLFGGQIDEFYTREKYITDAIWKHQLGENESLGIATLRSWLDTRDRMLKKLHKERLLTPEHRDEYTCEWFQRHLIDFSRSEEDVLALHGPEGCGKTYLSRWTVDRLQRPLGKKTYGTLYYTLESDIPSTTTSLAIAKSLSLQIFEKNVGDESLFHALVKAYDLSISKDVTVTKLEEALWEALDIGLDRFTGKGDDHLMIVIDGLDELKNHDNVKSVMDRMGLLTSKHDRLQAVTLSRTSPEKLGRGKIQPFQIKPDDTREDLRHIAEHALEDYVHYTDFGEHAREAIVEKLIHTARGKFLWLLLTIFLLRKESSSDAFEKALKAANETPLSLDQTLGRITGACDLAKSDARLSLSWMLVAERPMTLLELKSLLQVDLQNRNTIQRKTDIGKDLLSALGPLVLIHHEFVRIRHPAIREYLQGLQIHGTPALLKPRDAQADFAMRLLAYCKFNLTEHQEPSLEVINKTHVHELFTKHVLLEYAVRYWTNHIHASSMYIERSLQLSSEFKGIFPSSTSMAMLEWACWGPQTFSGEFYDLALRVRESVFTEKHECVLQSSIACGTFFRSTSRIAEAGHFFYRASRIGQAVLRKHHTLTVTCATTFLTMTETTTITTRTELVTRKEETLKYVIDVHKHQHGQTHDLVIRYYKMLAKLYVEIHEEQKAEAVWRELREIVISRFGKGSEEETGISKQLTIVLKKGDNKTNVVEYETGILEITRGLEVWDIRHIQLTLELALSYEARKELYMAEDLYVTLWRRLTERCHHSGQHHGVEIHIHMIDVALEYVRFLRRGHRHEEACNILICVWTGYEEYDFESETIFLRLKIVGELMRAVSLFSIAMSVFRKCWSWFKVKGKADHAASCEVLIMETIEEIITTMSTTTVSTSTTTSTTTSSTTEIVVKEVFESTLASEEVTSETISICKSLISYYMKLEQWSEALEVTRRSLLLIWKFVVSGAGTLALPQHFGTGAIDIAISLAICHQRSYHFHEAEEIYVRIYHACRNSCHVEDGRFVRCYEVLIEFYEEHHHWHKMIEVYQELLIQHRKRLGASHKLTIRTLYLLGSLCADHGYGQSHEYYEEIITVLNHGSNICHVDALNAMFAMCRVHYESGHWEKLKITCKILWETWRDRHHGHNSFTTDFVEMLYLRYRYVLEHHEACEYSVLRQLTIEYRNTCIKVFTAAAVITIKASIELAQLCMRSETYIHEAISIYEDVLVTIKDTTTTTTTTTTTSIISTMTITKIKESVNKAYVSLCSHGSVSVTIIERAIIIVRERFESLKITLGWAHTETLTCLRELVLLQMKLKKQETHTTILRTLVEACIEIIKVEKHSKTLHEAAKSLGSTYVTCGLSAQGRTMIEELRLQIITGVTKDKSSFKLDKAIGRVSYVFLVTFEQVIRGQVVSYSEIMADLLTEALPYEAYHRCVKSETDVTVILVHAARLRVFLANHHRKVQKERLEEESFQIFIKKWTTTIKSREEISRIFYIGLLIEFGKQSRDVQIGNAACAASIAAVREVLNKGHTQEAFEVTSCALKLIKHERAFHLLQNVPNGFKLSALMVGRGLEIPLKADTNTKLRESMLELSRNIIHEVLRACKDSNINFVRLRLPELNELAGLLGDQQNFAVLEWLLDLLWSSREVQKLWEPDTIVAIGHRFVQVRYLNKDHRSRAIRLCEDISYNLRRVWGSLDPKTLEMLELLSELYTSMGHYREAQGVHENILRLVVEGDDGDDGTIDTMPSQTALKHVNLLKQSFLRLKGWDKSAATYKDLVNALREMYKGEPEWKDVQSIDTWDFNKEKPSETLGNFVAPKEWEFAKPEALDGQGDVRGKKGLRRPGMGVKRATSNWGIGEVHRVLHGLPSSPNGGGKTNGAGGKIRGREDGHGADVLAKSPVGAHKPSALQKDKGHEKAEEPVTNGVKA